MIYCKFLVWQMAITLGWSQKILVGYCVSKRMFKSPRCWHEKFLAIDMNEAFLKFRSKYLVSLNHYYIRIGSDGWWQEI